MNSQFQKILGAFNIDSLNPGGFCGQWLKSGYRRLDVRTPINGDHLGRVTATDRYEEIVTQARHAFLEWRQVPAPKRGDLIRQLGNALDRRKKELGALISLEMGKTRAEGEGEVQEMIDMCVFAAGLSRSLNGNTFPSERPHHAMREQWHPLGVVGVISAFNFPAAVWSWNATLAIICGNAILWKPSSKTPLTAIACTRIAEEVCKANNVNPALFSLAVGSGADIGEALIQDKRIPLVSATGSTEMGRHVAEVVGKRLGRTILELGGNNAVIVTEHADLDQALPSILFGAIGTAGQRCTTTRRLIVHASLCDELTQRLIAAYKQVTIGNPLEEGILMGPLVDLEAVTHMMGATGRLVQEGGSILYGGERLKGRTFPGGCYVRPCIVRPSRNSDIVRKETFAPILYIIPYTGSVDAAIRLNNEVPQGLSSAIFTENLRQAETFLSAVGSDCGIANVGIGTSGAEIGGAFGGEKDTGGGREAGSDAWKQYMRRMTSTVYYGRGAPALAQGIQFQPKRDNFK